MWPNVTLEEMMPKSVTCFFIVVLSGHSNNLNICFGIFLIPTPFHDILSSNIIIFKTYKFWTERWTRKIVSFEIFLSNTNKCLGLTRNERFTTNIKKEKTFKDYKSRKRACKTLTEELRTSIRFGHLWMTPFHEKKIQNNEKLLINRIAQKVERFYQNIVEQSLFGKGKYISEGNPIKEI